MPDTILAPTDTALADLAAADGNAPLAALNLFAIRDTAAYDRADPEYGTAAANVSGAEALARYVAATMPLIAGLGGRPLLGSTLEHTFVGPEDAAWDQVAILWFPTRSAFSALLAHPEHIAASRHRSAALSNWRQFHLDGRPFLE